jgi:hypothetical protein
MTVTPRLLSAREGVLRGGMYGVCRLPQGMSEGVRRGGMYGVRRFLMLTNEERKSKFLFLSLLITIDAKWVSTKKERL